MTLDRHSRSEIELGNSIELYRIFKLLARAVVKALESLCPIHTADADATKVHETVELRRVGGVNTPPM